MLANLIVFLLTLGPLMIALAVVVGLRKWRERAGRRLPISAKVLHTPGEQLRQRVSAVEDDLYTSLVVLVFVGPFLMAIWALNELDLSKLTPGFLGWFCIVGGAAVVAFEIRKLVRLGIERRKLLEGLIAEQFTAQELNRLMAAGSIVFHDVPADGFNIDHVVIGASAVYAVETKSRKKPKREGNNDSHKVGYDGRLLRFPDHSSSTPIEQARRQAAWLSKEILRVTSKAVPVLATVSLPGWWIENEKSVVGSDVRVFNPAGKGAKFMAERTATLLDEPTRALVAQCISMRYPETPASLISQKS